MIKAPVKSKMLMVLLCAALIFDVTMSVCILSSPSQGFRCGIQGKVMESPAPAAASLQDNSSGDDICPYIVLYVKDPVSKRVITKVVSDEYGYFRVHLVPGRYLIELEPTEETVHLSGAPAVVDVEDGELTSVTVRVERRQTGHGRPARKTTALA